MQKKFSVAHLHKCSLCCSVRFCLHPSCVYTRGTPTQSNWLWKKAYDDARVLQYVNLIITVSSAHSLAQRPGAALGAYVIVTRLVS